MAMNSRSKVKELETLTSKCLLKNRASIIISLPLQSREHEGVEEKASAQRFIRRFSVINHELAFIRG